MSACSANLYGDKDGNNDDLEVGDDVDDGVVDDDMIFQCLCLLLSYWLRQGGRSCAGARVAPAEKFGLGRKF